MEDDTELSDIEAKEIEELVTQVAGGEEQTKAQFIPWKDAGFVVVGPRGINVKGYPYPYPKPETVKRPAAAPQEPKPQTKAASASDIEQKEKEWEEKFSTVKSEYEQKFKELEDKNKTALEAKEKEVEELKAKIADLQKTLAVKEAEIEDLKSPKKKSEQSTKNELELNKVPFGVLLAQYARTDQ